jgi:hypothetical protein
MHKLKVLELLVDVTWGKKEEKSWKIWISLKVLELLVDVTWGKKEEKLKLWISYEFFLFLACLD